MARSDTIREFTRQAQSFEAPGSHHGNVELLDWMAGHIETGAQTRVLDVAGGTGRLGRHLGRGGALTVIADLTPKMLRTGAEAAEREGRADVVYVEADATALPFPDGHFDVVVTRFALHHMDDVPSVLAEMRRVCAPGGSVTVIDMVADPGPPPDRLDELERLRDPSHTACPREPELRRQLEDAGLQVERADDRHVPLVAEEWLRRAQPTEENAQTVLAALRSEAGGGAPTGLRAADGDGGLTVTHRYLLLGCTPVS